MRPVGILYSDMTLPYDLNMNATPVGKASQELDINTVKYPFNGSLQINWDSNAIGDIMKKYNMTRAYYADKRTLSILLGIFSQETVIVSGD